MNPDNVTGAIEIAEKVISFIFSSIILLGISVIISGKLICRGIGVTSGSNDLFSINVGVFRIAARGDEVVFGFLVFLIALPIIIFAGGQDAYALFKTRSGVDAGQWNSMCIMASFLSLSVSALAFFYFFFSKGSPLISPEDRAAQLEEITRATTENPGGPSHGEE